MNDESDEEDELDSLSEERSSLDEITDFSDSNLKIKMAAKLCLKKLDGTSDTFVNSNENTEPFIQTAMTSIGSKIAVGAERSETNAD